MILFTASTAEDVMRIHRAEKAEQTSSFQRATW